MPMGRPPLAEIVITFVGTLSTLLLLCALTNYVSPMMDGIGWVVVGFFDLFWTTLYPATHLLLFHRHLSARARS